MTSEKQSLVGIEKILETLKNLKTSDNDKRFKVQIPYCFCHKNFKVAHKQLLSLKLNNWTTSNEVYSNEKQ